LIFHKISKQASTGLYEESIVLALVEQELVIDSHGIALTMDIDSKKFGLFLHDFFSCILRNLVLHALKGIYVSKFW